MIADAGVAKLLDLSIARPPGRVRPGLGTWCYLAPEQARGGHAGPAADVWGLGLLLHEALTGAPAFDGTEAHPCLVRRAPALNGRRPRALTGVIAAALDPDPHARPALAELLDTLDAVAGRPAGPGRWVTRG